jgi:hypothetical protein
MSRPEQLIQQQDAAEQPSCIGSPEGFWPVVSVIDTAASILALGQLD